MSRWLLGLLTLALSGACANRPRDEVVSPPLAARRDAGVSSVPIDDQVADHSSSGEAMAAMGPGFPEPGPWVSFYGNATQIGDPARVARAFRIINIDADPDEANLSDSVLVILKADGKNRVLSYLNIGSCEKTRSYWATAPKGFVSCGANKAAQRGSYDGYPDETWMDPGNADYKHLIVDHVAARLAARPVDGFYLDNLEILEHSSIAKTGWCDAACKQGGLDLVRALREKYPQLLLVMQNGTGEVTRLGMTGGMPFPSLLDGISHEEVYRPKHDRVAEQELLRWRAMNIRSKSGHPLWIGVEDYVGACGNSADAAAVFKSCRKFGFAPYVSDESSEQKVVCYWSF